MTHPKIFALLILLLTACQPDAPEENAAPPLRVTVLQAAPADLSPTLRLPGTLAAREEVAVTAALQGQRILSVAVEVGDRVRAGQVLAQLEHVNVQSQLQQTEAQLARARAQLRGSMVLGGEDSLARMGRLGRSEVTTGRLRSMAQSLRLLDAVTAQEVQDLAAHLAGQERARVLVGPRP